MRRKLLGLLCACLLLSGCQNGSSSSVPTQPPVTETAAAALPLLEQGIVTEESGNLRYIPNEAVESMAAPEMRLFGNGLLLSECRDDQLILKHIRLEDGATVTEASFAASEGTKLYIGSGMIGLCDPQAGLVSILDSGFCLQKTCEIPCQGDDWYLNSELDTLYIFFSDRGVLSLDLDSGKEIWLVDNGFRVRPLGSGSSYVIFEYTDRADQKTYTRYLNLSTASLETLPIGEAVDGGNCQGETWLFPAVEDGLYFLVDGSSTRTFVREDSPVRLLTPRRHLLMTDPSGRELTLYTADGAFLSRCALPLRSTASVGKDFVWSGYWEGYFFTDFVDSTCRLMFWDVHAETEGEYLPLSDWGAAEQTQPVVEAQLYERAAQLSRRFGVQIRIAEQCNLDYSHYDTYPLTDPVFIRSALDVLEASLSLYPEGFFHQLTYGSIQSIQIELVGGLTAKSDVDSHPDSIGAFAQDRGSHYLVAMDGFLLQPQTVFHEFSHIIDKRLEWDSLIREDALYSEAAWLALQPEGFRYALSYTEIPADVQKYMDSRYFLSEYALCYPTEDRAVLMESAMANYPWDFEPDSGTRTKLQFYAACIRDCFDTTGWPETTLWEQVLH